MLNKFIIAILLPCISGGCSLEKEKTIYIDNQKYVVPVDDIQAFDINMPFYYLNIKGRDDGYRIIWSDKNERKNFTSGQAPTVAHINDGYGYVSRLEHIGGIPVVCNPSKNRWKCGTTFFVKKTKWTVSFSDEQKNNVAQIISFAESQIDGYRRK